MDVAFPENDFQAVLVNTLEISLQLLLDAPVLSGMERGDAGVEGFATVENEFVPE